jgi:hypothetical protein
MSAEQIASIVTQLARTNGKATTNAVAAHCYVCDRTALRWLKRVEGVAVKRVGVKGGWLPLAA